MNLDIHTTYNRQTSSGDARELRPPLPSESALRRWYVIYTSANHEKRIGEQLNHRLIEHFIPLYKSIRQWKDRRVVLQVPLFPGYVFVRIALRDQLKVVQIAGVARFIGFNGTPTALAENEIESLRTGLRNGIKAEPHPFLVVGRRVRVNSGPFSGASGILIRRKGKSRVVISIDLLKQSVAVEVLESDLSSMS